MAAEIVDLATHRQHPAKSSCTWVDPDAGAPPEQAAFAEELRRRLDNLVWFIDSAPVSDDDLKTQIKRINRMDDNLRYSDKLTLGELVALAITRLGETAERLAG